MVSLPTFIQVIATHFRCSWKQNNESVSLRHTAMTSIENATSMVSEASGLYMFDAFFQRQLGPPIMAPAALTALSALPIWLLPETPSDVVESSHEDHQAS